MEEGDLKLGLSLRDWVCGRRLDEHDGGVLRHRGGDL